jgi:HAD superfamily hydrolase (TIGR01509 family)
VTAPRFTANELDAILFDYGGTLDGDAQHWFDHFVRLYAEAGSDLTAAQIKPGFYAADDAITRDPDVRHFGLDRMVRTHVALQLRHLGVHDEPLGHTLAERFIADTRAAWNRNRPLLARLSRRFRLGVVSNSYGNMPVLLAEAALADFAVVLDSAVVGVAKPDPALYRLAVGELAVPPAAILHVGDSWERDVAAAQAAGLRTAWLAPAAATMPAEPPDVWRLSSLLELEVLLA